MMDFILVDTRSPQCNYDIENDVKLCQKAFQGFHKVLLDSATNFYFAALRGNDKKIFLKELSSRYFDSN